ncbi:MAG: heavy-metal-associated domain-containing protein [Patescibacteria group bacterium]|mgnify:CR=1 FL=1
MKKTYKIDGMHCVSCAMLIEGELEDAGIRATCSYIKQTLEVEGEESPFADTAVKQAVEKAGYTVRNAS